MSRQMVSVYSRTWCTRPHAEHYRRYAGAQIKLLLGRFVVDYDFKLPEGQLTRPPNPHIDEKILPDMKQTFMVRKR